MRFNLNSRIEILAHSRARLWGRASSLQTYLLCLHDIGAPDAVVTPSSLARGA